MPQLPGPGGMVMTGGTICGKWGQSSMPVVDEAGVGIRMGSMESAGGGGHPFGVAPNVEQTLLVVRIEANLAVNMMAPCQHRVQEMGGDLGDVGLLGGTTVGVDRMVDVILGLGKDKYRPYRVKGSSCSEGTGGH